MDRMTRVLTDGQWAVLAPLIEAGRPHRKTRHHDLRRTIEAIVWRCQNGAKWRSSPTELGPRSGLLTRTPVVMDDPSADGSLGGLLAAAPLEIGSAVC